MIPKDFLRRELIPEIIRNRKNARKHLNAVPNPQALVDASRSNEFVGEVHAMPCGAVSIQRADTFLGTADIPHFQCFVHASGDHATALNLSVHDSTSMLSGNRRYRTFVCVAHGFSIPDATNFVLTCSHE